MTPTLPFDAGAQPWLRAAAHGVAWLESQLNGTGRLPAELHDLGSYYKWPLALATLGRLDLAKQLFDTLIDSFLTADGDFRTSAEKSADPLYGQIADTYTNTWPLVAAHVLERPDVGEAGLECLRRRHVVETGGYLTGALGQHDDRRQDIVTIAGCGNALLAWGHLDEATTAGDALLSVLGQQGPVDGLFHLYIDGNGELLRGDLGIPETLARIDPSQPGQAYVYWGMAAVFLARLFVVSGEARFLDGARETFARHDACGDAVYDGLGCCKTGWAAATLYRITDGPAYQDVVHRAAAELVRIQGADGDWSRPQLTPMLNCDCTGELVYHLSQYTLELASAGADSTHMKA
ncbi:MAG TPA: hypothetical protein QGF95_17740 [Candidatus Latescibacteria bacterium]|nr:hypothetical protein [Gemmatimonadaceae bacterium]MDP6017107.1 hypothetical protein [Candidatus Latescibacterota bacterium]HJP32391.1 hypothetical protein [Candidatus Latescibacterota bacterium]